MIAVSEPVRADEADEPVGSAYLRPLSVPEPPFGRTTRDSFPYDGVRIQRGRRDDPPADWLIVWIDLRTPGLGYRISPVTMRTGPAGLPLQATEAQTTADFLRRSGDPPIDLAVNTVAYWPFPAANGLPVFLSEPVWQGDDNAREPAAGSLMLGLLPGRAALGEADAIRAMRPRIAFGSFFGEARPEESVLVRHGAIVQRGGQTHGRTAAGVSADGRVLLLLVADGYNPGVSEGLTPGDAARLLHAAGARDAVFLDGGGSSTLVGRGPDGRPVVINRPAGLQKRPGTLRYVAVNLGFTGLRPGDDAVPSLPGGEAPLLIRIWEESTIEFRVRPVRSTLIALSGIGVLIAIALGVWRFRRRSRRIHLG